MLTPSYIASQRLDYRQRIEQAAVERKVSKYAGLQASHLFIPIAIEALSPINDAGDSFLSELGL